MRIIYIPIDERPCNTEVVKRIANSTSDIELLLPPAELFGLKKSPSNTERLWEWLQKEAEDSDAVILSIDMIIYGGIIPSRLHEMSEETGLMWMERLRSFHKAFPNLPIYASNLIMRTPKYSSGDEEPSYYEYYGREIFLQAYLKDKKTHDILSSEELDQLQDLEREIPQEFIEDYETRRSFNVMINECVLDLVKEGVLTFLAIPQDDSAEYGYTAMDQKVISFKRIKLRLYKQVHIYPGADEVGATLLARVYNGLKGLKPKIYPIWSSTLGAQLIPMYEDRPFAESMKGHILAAGCQLVDHPDSADLILAYNTPGRVMQESWDQSKKDITYSTFRNMMSFTDQIKQAIESGKKVIVADSAYANGGDLELIALLDEEEILDKLLSYKGWNTNCNTLGTTISQGVIGQFGNADRIKENIMYHLLDDYFYQAEIRMEMVSDFLLTHNLSYFDLKDKAKLVNLERDQRLLSRFQAEIKNSFKHSEIEELHTYAPWNRMFECGIELKVKFK
ncbi:DUF4127 family protein [Virgibacillus sp. NKC19-16]|uniref:DUF4127 family protein n=1 Tax=Virgibacillus salidurans TaxID=2831673 RepID=UPI001F163429|nr:DUF4127 family protein [Virgibacillus sp. NKC19-16]UJL45775.1 DUF4127 family protein [Virgibacillus sp. NKC19-16]